MAYLSGKRGDEIGRFGLGFKSVLAVTRSPQVFSRSIAFDFNRRPGSSASLPALSKAKRYPALRTPTQLDAVAAFEADPILAELAEWATTIVKLPYATNLERLAGEIKDFRSEFLLFVSAVREVRLRIVGETSFKTSSRFPRPRRRVLRIERP